MQPEPLLYGDRKVYTVSAFNSGVASWIARLPTLWVEGEVIELRRQPSWHRIFFTLRDPDEGSCLAVTMGRAEFDELELDLADGRRVHVQGQPELYQTRGVFQLRASAIEPLGLGDLLAGLDRLRRRLAAEGLFDVERKRTVPSIPERLGLVTGVDAAAKRDVIAAVTTRFPPARMVIAETSVQGARAPLAIVGALQTLAAQPGVDGIILARGGGSFEDLLPFSDERVVRAVASCPVPVISAIGHEHDTPLCDLAADIRASTPTAAARLVVPDQRETSNQLNRLRSDLGSAVVRCLDHERSRLVQSREALGQAPRRALERARLMVERDGQRLEAAVRLAAERQRAQIDGLLTTLRALSPRSTLERGYAIVQAQGRLVRTTRAVSPGASVAITLWDGSFTARVEELQQRAER